MKISAIDTSDAKRQLDAIHDLLDHRAKIYEVIRAAEVVMGRHSDTSARTFSAVKVGGIWITSDEDAEAYNAVLAALKRKIMAQDEKLHAYGIEITDEKQAEEVVT